MVELIEVSSCGQGGNSGKETFEVVITIMSCFICILGSSNSSTITFLNYSARSNEAVSELVIQMTVEPINNLLISVLQKR